MLGALMLAALIAQPATAAEPKPVPKPVVTQQQEQQQEQGTVSFPGSPDGWMTPVGAPDSNTVPEPSTLWLVAGAVAMCIAYGRRA